MAAVIRCKVLDAMLALVEDRRTFNTPDKRMGKEHALIGKMLLDLRRDFYNIDKGTLIGQRRNSHIWMEPQRVYGDFHCDDDWSQLVKSLRIADDDICHLRFINTYVEEHLNAFLEEIKDIRKVSDYMTAQLDALSKIEDAFNEAATARLSESLRKPDVKRTKKAVKFGNVPRKSKSAECSVYRICSSCGLMVADKACSGTVRRDLSGRRKSYGKYCSACGAVEISSHSSLVRCRVCEGEIIIQGLCSSCESLKGVPRQVRKDRRWPETLLDKACSTCDLTRKKISWDDKEMKWTKAKGNNQKDRGCVYHEKPSRPNLKIPKIVNYLEDSSCCSDCGPISYRDMPFPENKGKCSNWNLSTDSLMPTSESDHVNMYVRTYSQDYDVSSSVSSSETDKICKMTPESNSPTVEASRSQDVLPQLPEETLSVDEGFNTPREFLSVEDFGLPVSEVTSKLSNVSTSTYAVRDESNAKTVVESAQLKENEKSSELDADGKLSDSEDFAEAVDLEKGGEDTSAEDGDKSDVFEDPVGEFEDLSPAALLRGEVVEHPVIIEIRGRIRKAEELMSDISIGNTKLEGDIFAMENVSLQNLNLSAVLREIMLGITSHLDFMQSHLNERRTREPESEGSDEFEEALEDLVPSGATDSDGETFYDIPPPNYYYLCLECGIRTSYKSPTKCLTCGGAVSLIPNDLLGDGWRSSAPNQLTPAVYHPKNWQMDWFVHAVYPLYMKTEFSRFPLGILEKRLKVIEKEANLLKDNNELINLLVDGIQKKLKDDLKDAQSGAVESNESGGESEPSERTIVEFDVSFYQIRRLFTERNDDGEPKIEEISEETRKSTKTFIEMKFEEVYKKEAQTVLELEVFEEKLAVEGLIIKEMEEFYTCSNTSQAIDFADETRPLPAALLRRFTSERFQTVRGETENDELMISIEIEVEKELQGRKKKAVRCEYKANLQRGGLKDQSCMRRQDSVIPTLTLYPMSVTEKIRSTVNDSTEVNRKMALSEMRQYPTLRWERSNGGFSSGEPYCLDAEGDGFVEIKPPKFFYGSSDEETESCAGDYVSERRSRKSHSFSAVKMPEVLHPVVVIALTETPFAVLSTLSGAPAYKKEFGRISQIELGVAPSSGVVLMQTQAMTPVELFADNLSGSLEEFHEARSLSGASDATESYADCSAESIRWETTLKHRSVSSSMVLFEPVNMGKVSLASIALLDNTLPVVVVENVEPAMVGPLGTPSPLTVAPNEELDTALSLIREIESDVVEVKLHSAIEILPQLESVLREHLQGKLKILKKNSSTMTASSLDIFMSTLNILTEANAGEPSQSASESTVFVDAESEERLGKMLQMLTGLEQAVKEIARGEDHEPNTNRICNLLQSLGNQVRGMEENPSLADVQKTIELTSELDVAVRGYSSDAPFGGNDASEGSHEMSSSEVDDDGFVVTEQLKSIKRRIFDIVAAEAREREERVERDFERIDRLEKENAEAMRFLDTLLDKTLRRVGELDEIRDIVECLREALDELEATLTQMATRFTMTENRTSSARNVRVGKRPTLPRIAEVSSDNRTSESSEEETVRTTLSSMIVALDTLKTKAVEKKRRYKEIFGIGADAGVLGRPLPLPEKPKTSQESSEDACNDMKASITEFSRIGSDTYYLSWTRPVVSEEDCVIAGYEIWINGKVNQRVRNPERLKAVLYSVHSASPPEKLKVKLFALTEDGRRQLLDDLKYPEVG